MLNAYMPRVLPFLVLAVVTPALAVAQSFPAPTTSGEVELEYLSGDGSDATVIFGDVDLSFGPASGGTGFGVDLGIYAIDTDTLSGEVALFAALSYTTSYGKFSFGIPRSAASAFSRMPDIGGIKLLSITQDQITRGIVAPIYLLADDTPVGLRYDGDYGVLKTAVSLHYLSDSEAKVADFALRYDTGRFFANGALEYVDAPGTSTQSSVHLEIGASAEFYEAGLGYTKGSNFIPDAVMAWASYRPAQPLALTASVIDSDASGAIYGLSGDYTFENSVYLQAGMADSSDFDPVWDLSLGYKF